MLAIHITQPGGPDVLVPVERPRPAPGRGEALISVAAAGVNRPDVLQRLGKYPPPPGAPDIPGLEVAGTVVALGPEAGQLRVGDRVCALLAGGGYAEYAVAPEVQCLPSPDRLDLVAAAGIPETFFTVWANLFEAGRLQPGEWLLVHGGAGGIGTTAIQLGRAFGARVLATAGSAAKCAACERLGAEEAINYRDTDFVASVRARTQGRGVDVILDIVGGDYVHRNLESLSAGGRLVQIAFLGGSRAEIDLSPILRRHLTMTGSTLRPRPVAEKGRLAAAIHQHIWPLLEAGTIAPVVHATFPLARAADAHRLMESGDHIGKIILVTGSERSAPGPPRP
jgi:putative PIG3 family NAD(P)H quinone oxidoreductase